MKSKKTTAAIAIHDCMTMERTMQQLFGYKSKWYHSASWYSDPKVFRKAILAATRRIASRLSEIVTVDDRLRLTTMVTIKGIEASAKAIDANGRGLQEAVAQLLSLVALLLGYDWLEGKPNREIVFYQTRMQQDNDDIKKHPDDFYWKQKAEHKATEDLVCNLYSQGNRIAVVGRIMNMNDYRVKTILTSRGLLKKGINIRDST